MCVSNLNSASPSSLIEHLNAQAQSQAASRAQAPGRGVVVVSNPLLRSGGTVRDPNTMDGVTVIRPRTPARVITGSGTPGPIASLPPSPVPMSPFQRRPVSRLGPRAESPLLITGRNTPNRPNTTVAPTLALALARSRAHTPAMPSPLHPATGSPVPAAVRPEPTLLGGKPAREGKKDRWVQRLNDMFLPPQWTGGTASPLPGQVTPTRKPHADHAAFGAQHTRNLPLNTAGETVV